MSDTTTFAGAEFERVEGVDQFHCYRCGCEIFYDNPEIIRANKAAGKRYLENVPVYCGPCWQTVVHEARARESAAATNERIRRLIYSTYSRGWMPEEGRCVRFGGRPDIEAANSAAWRHGQHERGNMWLRGPQGVGKSGLGYAVLNAAISDGRTAAAIRCVDLNMHQFSEARGYQEKGRADYLLIDDIDKPVWRPIGLELLWSIIDSRQKNSGRVIITANNGTREFTDQVKAARPDNTSIAVTMLDRLMPCEVFKMGGKSWRRES